MPQILRHSGPGAHSLAGTVLVFDAQGVATSDDPAVIALARQFPEAFTVLKEDKDTEDVPAQAAPATEDAPAEAVPPWTPAALEGLTVAELRELASTAGIPRVSSLHKADLVAALCAAQE